MGLCLLVLLWIGTYWLYEPGRPASGAEVSFDEPVEATLPVPPPDPDPIDEAPVTFEDPPQGGATDLANGGRTDGAVIRAPEFRDYVVKDGETFKSIARDELGNVGLWNAIARSNPLRDPRRLKAGDVIRLPLDPANIQGVLVSGDTGEPLDGGAGVPDEEPWVEYSVKSGDSLSRISQAYYGSSRHADAIFDANRDQLRSPDALKIGQVLLLPPITTDD